MATKTVTIGGARVDYHFAGGLPLLRRIADPKKTILLTDEHLMALHPKKFRGWKTIVIPAGEQHKVQATADSVIGQLIGMEAGRDATLVGIGGGVITDLAGYVAAVYKRGIDVGFVPTTLLALVDASIGGKNGVDVGPYKNMVGTIRQPRFILHDLSLLNTLPEGEWSNGFAEIIKHACILDAPMFRELEGAGLQAYRKKKTLLCALIQRNALLKTRVVQGDEGERGARRLLNFGHTLAHAVETPYRLQHGEAVSIGMAFASRLSRDFTGFKGADRVVGLLQKFGLPTELSFDAEKTFSLLKGDKKVEGDAVHFILLQRIGKGLIQPIPLSELYKALQ